MVKQLVLHIVLYRNVHEFWLHRPILVFLLYGRFLTFMQGYKNQVYNFIVFILIIDFCRSEMSGYLFLVPFISLYFLTKKVKLK